MHFVSRVRVALIFGTLAVSGLGGCQRTAEPSDGCANDCESNIWPRLIVDVVAESDAGVADLVQISARYADGRTATGVARGCPEIPNVLCTVSFGAGPLDSELVLRAEQRGYGPVEASIPLSSFNYCGRSIAYVLVTTGDGAPRVGELHTLSPCAGLK